MKEIILGTMMIITAIVGINILVKEEGKQQDKKLKNEIEKIKIIIEEFKK